MSKRFAAITGYTEWKAQKSWHAPMFTLEAMATLAAETLADAGLDKSRVDGLAISGVAESPMFAPAAVAEYLGIESSFNEVIDLGGASAAALVMRAAMAIETGVCSAVLVLTPGVPPPPNPEGATSKSKLLYMGGDSWGSPQGLYDIPAGLVAAIPSYAMIAQRYRAEYGLDERILAKISVAQRQNAMENPLALFHGKPITIDDVMNSRMMADPIKMLEVVMPCTGGSAVLVTNAEIAKELNHRPVWVSGYGEHLSHKSILAAKDLMKSPLVPASARAFAMAGRTPADMDMASIYDCFTITVLLTLENAGFCAPGQGQAFLTEHELTWDGDFPLNTHGGQLSFGQAGMGGAMSHVVEAARQIQGRAEGRQVKACDRVYCNGNGGMMAEHVVLVLEGE